MTLVYQMCSSGAALIRVLTGKNKAAPSSKSSPRCNTKDRSLNTDISHIIYLCVGSKILAVVQNLALAAGLQYTQANVELTILGDAMNMREITRREFLSATAVGAAGLALGSAGILAPSRAQGANERLRVGVIGAGERMDTLMKEFNRLKDSHNCELVAVNDIWTVNRDKAVKKIADWYGFQPKVYRTYEEMLAAKDIDAVMIGTADFQHAEMLRKAILAGKHCYCEKPTANTLEDANALIAAAEANPNIIVQVGTQRRSEGNFQAAAEFIKSGALGKIARVNVSWNYYGARWIRDHSMVKMQDVDWRQFQMGRTNRPFDSRVFRQWRIYLPYSTGIPCQWMSHMVDAVNLVMGTSFPKSCVAMGDTLIWKDERQNADTFEALFEYPEGFILNYTTGFGNDAPGTEFKIYGTKGTLDCSSWKARGAGGGKDIKLSEEIDIKGEPRPDHMCNWVESVRSGKQPIATVMNGYEHAIAVVMGVRAQDTGRRQMFDPATRTISQA